VKGTGTVSLRKIRWKRSQSLPRHAGSLWVPLWKPARRGEEALVGRWLVVSKNDQSLWTVSSNPESPRAGLLVAPVTLLLRRIAEILWFSNSLPSIEAGVSDVATMLSPSDSQHNASSLLEPFGKTPVVSRYFCLLLRGLSGIVISIRPASSAGNK